MIPGIATSWKALDDTTWEFKLRKGVKFHDGSELTAEDVAFSIDRVPQVPEQPRAVRRVHQGDRRQGDRRPVHDPLQDRGAASAGAQRPVDDLHRVEEGRDRRHDRGLQHRQGGDRQRPLQVRPVRRTATASSSRATTPTGARSPPGTRCTFKIIKNEPARVAALLSGDVDAIEQLPTADLARLKADPEVHADVEDLAPRHLLQLRPPRPRRARSSPTRTASRSTRTRCSTRACAARSRKAINRPAIAERVMEGQAIPSGQLVSEKLFGHVPGAQGRGLRSGRREEAARRGRLSGRLQPHDPRAVRPLRQRREDRAGRRADAVARRHRRQGRDRADGAVLRARASKQEFSFHMVGWGASTGEASVAAALAARDVQPRQGPGRRQLGPLQQSEGRLPDRAGAAAGRRREPPRSCCSSATEAAMEDSGIMPIHFQFTIWATKKGVQLHAAHRRVHARVPVQAAVARLESRRIRLGGGRTHPLRSGRDRIRTAA